MEDSSRQVCNDLSRGYEPYVTWTICDRVRLSFIFVRKVQAGFHPDGQVAVHRRMGRAELGTIEVE